MSIRPFKTIERFLLDNPQRNHSSRILSKLPPIIGIAVSVADAFLRDVVAAIFSASVADAFIREVSARPSIGLGVTSLAFTSTPVGSTKTMTVVITNNGSTDLVISSLTTSGDFVVAAVTA